MNEVTGRGRPSTGVKVQVRIPDHLLEALDELAAEAGHPRASLVRDAVRDYVSNAHRTERIRRRADEVD